MSDRSPSPKSDGASITGRELVEQSDVLCEPDEEETTSSTNPEPVTKDIALTSNGRPEEPKEERCRDTPRWTEDDRRLVQNSYLLSLPRW